MKRYDVIIVGAGPGGIYCAKELADKESNLSILLLEKGTELEYRNCPINSGKVDSCVNCTNCSIMNGFGGAGAYSDGKFVISNNYGGNLCEYTGNENALDLMSYVDECNQSYLNEPVHLFDSKNASFKIDCIRNDIHILNAKVRHLGTDLNYRILRCLFNNLKDRITMEFNSEVVKVERCSQQFPFSEEDHYVVHTKSGNIYWCKYCIISVGRSGSKWTSELCKNLDIKTKSNKVDIGVRVELPHEVFAHITDEVYESKLVYRTQQYNDLVRTFCMNPHGEVVAENTNGIVTVNGHSYEDEVLKTDNTNFALLVSKNMTAPFDNSNEYGESIARLSNMLGQGVIVQRFGDLVSGRRSTEERIQESFVRPTLNATPGDLSLVMPKRFLDDIIEMIYALDRIAPGTANDDTLLYGVEVKFYNMMVEVNNQLEAKQNLYIIGDGSGVTHSLAQASASGVYVARNIMIKETNQ